MKKRILSLGLAVVLILSLFSTLCVYAENAPMSYKVDVTFDELLCTVEMYDYYTSSPISSGEYINETYDETRSEYRAYLTIGIKDIKEGYRIECVKKNGLDVTSTFVSGAYGSMATTIDSDTTFEIEINEMPDSLPVITDTVGIYSDRELSDKVSGEICFDEDFNRLYTCAIFSDGSTYPEYFSECHWEYSTDSETWMPLTYWGSRTDFWAAWPSHTSDRTDQCFDFMNNEYYLRAHLFGRDGYSTGEVYTDILSVCSDSTEGSDPEQDDDLPEIDLNSYTIIRTEEDLKNIVNDLGGSYILANDITLTQDWIPIDVSSFSGVLDGNGYAIKNFNIITIDKVRTGLFGINTGTIKNLTIFDANIEIASPYMDTNCGIISALNKTSGIIENCKVTGKIVGNGTMGSIGGIAGSNLGTISQCCNEADIIIKNPDAVSHECWIFAAGIAGSNKGTIRDCYNIGDIDIQGNSSFFSVICAAGICSGESFYNTTISNCYNIGSVNATVLSQDSEYSNSVYTGEISCKECSLSRGTYYLEGKNTLTHWNETGLSEEEFKDMSNFKEFDFDNIWTMGSQDGEFVYPVHKQHKTVSVPNASDISRMVPDFTFTVEKSSIIDDEDVVYYPTDYYQFGTSAWAETIKSHLIDNHDGTYTRVEYIGEKSIIIENYSQDFELLSTKTIQFSLPLYGGFYAGTEYNFVVCGQSNDDEDDTLPTFRVIKYSKDWEELASVDYCDNNTTCPFDAGSLRMVEYAGVLYVRTAHQMYTTDDGLRHQANITFSVTIDDMEIKDTVSYISNSSEGYVSHSFNQFIDIVDGKLIAADHGDAYPRSMILFRYIKDLDESGSFTNGYWGGGIESARFLHFAGEIGENATDAALSDLSHSDSNYIAVGNYADFGKNTRNVYVVTINKEDMSTVYKKLTNYPESGKFIVSAPHLVKINENCFLAIWKRGGYSGEENNNLSIAVLDGDGNLKSNISTASGCLDQCHPILSGDKVVWYYTIDSKPIFYSIDVSKLIEDSQDNFKSATYVSKKAIQPVILCDYSYSYMRYSTKVSLYAGDSDAKIYYTTNGTEPTTSSTLYTGEFTINKTSQVKAISVAPNLEQSDVISKTIILASKPESDDDKTESSGGGGGGGGGGGDSGNDSAEKEETTKKEETPKEEETPKKDETSEKDKDNNVFSDVRKTDWYYEAVTFAFEKGITSGVSKTSYAPNNKVTRGQFITMLCRAYGIKERSGNNFADCGNTWYTGYLAAAKQLGISNGIGGNKFAPEKEITREEMVTLIYNYLKSIGEVEKEIQETTFADNNLISDWAKAGVAFASSKGYVEGKGNNSFDPDGDATRAELAQIFFNMLK